jgi:hypothetical protein
MFHEYSTREEAISIAFTLSNVESGDTCTGHDTRQWELASP